MLQLARPAEPVASPLPTVFTIEGRITSSGSSVRHLQFVTPGFVITSIGRSLILHCVARQGRFVIDQAAEALRPVSAETQRVQIDHLRGLVGEVTVHRDPQPVEVDGYRCRRYRICNDSARITVSAEAFCATVPGMEHTALWLERSLEAELHPFAVPLDPGEIVVRSTTRTFANGFQHTQEYALQSLLPRIDDLPTLERLLAYRVLT